MTETVRHLRVVREPELPPLRPLVGTTHPVFGWQSARYPHTNSQPHDIKLLRYPPNGNVDEWVDFGPDGAPEPGAGS